MAKLTITFDSPREEAAAGPAELAYFEEFVTNYLRNKIESEAFMVLRNASAEVREAVLQMADKEKAAQDVAKAEPAE